MITGTMIRKFEGRQGNERGREGRVGEKKKLDAKAIDGTDKELQRELIESTHKTSS